MRYGYDGRYDANEDDYWETIREAREAACSYGPEEDYLFLDEELDGIEKAYKRPIGALKEIELKEIVVAITGIEPDWAEWYENFGCIRYVYEAA